jgi:hypothetical protein
MRLTPNPYRHFSVILSATLILTSRCSDLSRDPHASGISRPTQPLIAIWDASSVATSSWDKNEVPIPFVHSRAPVSDLLVILQHEPLCILLFTHNVIFDVANPLGIAR